MNQANQNLRHPPTKAQVSPGAVSWAGRRAFACTLALLLAYFGGLRTSDAIIHASDTDTIALYHFDETTPDGFASGRDFEDAGFNGFDAFGFDIAPGQIILGQSALAGLGNALHMVGPTNAPEKRNAVTAVVDDNAWAGGSFTLEAWIKNPGSLANADFTTGRLIAQQRDSAIAWTFGLNPNGGFRLFGNTAGGVAHSTAGLTWENDLWYYVALVADTAGSGAGLGEARYSFYRATNGATALTLVDSIIGNAATNVSASNFRIAGETAASTRTFHGFIDEVHYSGVARSEQYLLAHVPEPTHAMLIAFGSVLFLGWRRKRH